MIISHKFKIVFIHIPKNGGCYIKSILFKLDPNYLIVNDYYNEKLYGHLPYFKIKNLEIYEQIKDYTFFCTIRNPINNLISYYNYILTCKETHFMYNEIKNYNFYEAIPLIINEYKEIIYHIKEKDGSYDPINNPINKSIYLLNFMDLSNNFKNFLINTAHVPIDVLSTIDFNLKVNESEKKFSLDYNDTKLINSIQMHFDERMTQDMLFYMANTYN